VSRDVQVTIRLFAMLREEAGWRERNLLLGGDATIDDAWQALVALHPQIAAHRASVRFARNGRYAASDEALADGDEVAVIPPVAGGAAATGRMELTADPIDDELLGELRRTLPTAADGALVLFVGQTRETPGMPAPGQEAAAARHAGSSVVGLDYEAFREMVLDVFAQIGAEVEARFGVRRLAIVHRVGRVQLSEPSVVIAAAAAHRAEAFDACRYAIEELKARAPIWKSELYTDGSVWVGEPARDAPGPATHDERRERR
jgi:molybdopterin converting factor subunit 1